MPTIRIVNYPVYYPVKSDNPPDNPPDRPPERRWPWSASARLPPSTTLGATFKQGRTRSRCHLDYFGNDTARRRNTAVTVRKGMGGGSRTEVAVRRFAPYPASSTRSAPPLCEAWALPTLGALPMPTYACRDLYENGGSISRRGYRRDPRHRDAGSPAGTSAHARRGSGERPTCSSQVSHTPANE